ncbi:hypothetical protein BH23ACT10_BH23ACT10_13410 [soil metagenome]
MTRRLKLTAPARQDLLDLKQDDVALVRGALRVAKRIERGEIDGVALRDFGKTGDLRDCRKVYFGAEPGADTHRIVFRILAGGEVEIVEIVAVAQREADVAYLQAALRLERIEDPVPRSDAQRRIHRSRRRRPR